MLTFIITLFLSLPLLLSPLVEGRSTQLQFRQENNETNIHPLVGRDKNYCGGRKPDASMPMVYAISTTDWYCELLKSQSLELAEGQSHTKVLHKNGNNRYYLLVIAVSRKHDFKNKETVSRCKEQYKNLLERCK
ncbi:hypothetical protein P280DRAFT_296510 [Massarina eburnea CBS 473.64]|uniref:Secreted protein n=1 Tax=Massarina eburnea CBS 473.64 TaxID=1395130 RepID=A0A6A6S506_9PLEO|nr:hypothetical protein P280DRAFT_296510 [Massarina eburnea CBS 473.64]